MMDPFAVTNIDAIDTPALLLYKERIIQNITEAVKMIGETNRLRPHVKTNKISEVCALMMQAGICKFKCATIAEAEMLALNGAADVLFAYQPVGPKANRFLQLTQAYPQTAFSCLVDDAETGRQLSRLFEAAGKKATVFIDLNTGMNRTGIAPEKAAALFAVLQSLPGLTVRGLHSYDGHLNYTDFALQTQRCKEGYEAVERLKNKLEVETGRPFAVVAGGTPTFPVHAERDVECSPGTFVFWDWGYKIKFPEQPFVYAALVATRVVCVVDESTITIDLGHKSVAAENPLPRVYFLNAPDAVPSGQSEEHLVLKVPDSSVYKVGDVLYGVPVHICPTVALYERGIVIENNRAISEWKVVGRDRRITI